MGVLEERGSTVFSNSDTMIYVPLGTAQKLLLGIDYLNFARGKVDSPLNIERSIADVGILLRERHDIEENEEADFLLQNIKDSQLQMMFAVCNPAIASEAQIGLALRILCGFGIDEIAEAFLSNKETINKRLFRAKEKLRNLLKEANK